MTSTAVGAFTVGRVGVDMYPEQAGVPLDGVMTFARFLGGTATNVAAGAARLGHSTPRSMSRRAASPGSSPPSATSTSVRLPTTTLPASIKRGNRGLAARSDSKHRSRVKIHDRPSCLRPPRGAAGAGAFRRAPYATPRHRLRGCWPRLGRRRSQHRRCGFSSPTGWERATRSAPRWIPAGTLTGPLSSPTRPGPSSPLGCPAPTQCRRQADWRRWWPSPALEGGSR